MCFPAWCLECYLLWKGQYAVGCYTGLIKLLEVQDSSWIHQHEAVDYLCLSEAGAATCPWFHTQDASHSFPPSSISQPTPHPQGVKLIFPRPQGITKRQRGKHAVFEEQQISALLLCSGSFLIASWRSCVLAPCCATGTKRDVPSKINQNQHMLQSSSIKCFLAEPLR